MLEYAIHTLPMGPLTVVFRGDLTERAANVLRSLRRDLAPTLGNRPLVFDCSGIENVNSIGSVGWIAFVNDVAKVTPYELHGLTVTLVTYANMLVNFTKGGTVVSFFAPFHCPPCAKLFEVRIQAADFVAAGDYPACACSRCGTVMMAEIDAGDFGRFLLAPPRRVS